MQRQTLDIPASIGSGIFSARNLGTMLTSFPANLIVYCLGAAVGIETINLKEHVIHVCCICSTNSDQALAGFQALVSFKLGPSLGIPIACSRSL